MLRFGLQEPRSSEVRVNASGKEGQETGDQWICRDSARSGGQGRSVFPMRLRLARRRCGLSMHALAKRLSPPISLQSIAKYESGRMMPSPPVLESILRVLDVHPDFLLSGRIEFLEAVEAAGYPRASRREAALLDFRALAGIEERLMIDPPNSSHLLQQLPCATVRGQQDIELLAGQLRKRCGEGTGPVSCMQGLVERFGIRVIEADIPEPFSGRAYHAQRRQGGTIHPVVLLSSRGSCERNRLALAGELGRRVVRWQGDGHMDSDRGVQRFGAAFLVPADSLFHEVGVRRKWISRRELLDVKVHYGVPAVVLLKRMREVGVLSRRACERVLRGYARAWRNLEPEPTFRSGAACSERSRRSRLVWRALAEDRIPPERAAELLQLEVQEIRTEMREAVSRCVHVP